jgi:hypothetical protein
MHNAFLKLTDNTIVEQWCDTVLPQVGATLINYTNIDIEKREKYKVLDIVYHFYGGFRKPEGILIDVVIEKLEK